MWILTVSLLGLELDDFAFQVANCHNHMDSGSYPQVFRVDESQIVHLAGLSKDSPLRGKARLLTAASSRHDAFRQVLPGWKVNTINGRRVKAPFTEKW